MAVYTSDSTEFEVYCKRYQNSHLIVLAEGDSWFAYPRQFLIIGDDSNILDCLNKPENKFIIYSQPSNGDDLRSMLSGNQKHSLFKRIKHSNIDLLFLSGGGNDIVGKYDLEFLLKVKTDGMTWEDCINMHNLENKIENIKYLFRELIEKSLELRKNQYMKILTHTYDYVIPSKYGFEFIDIYPMGESWMYPIMYFQKKIVDSNDQREISKFLLESFKKKLLELKDEYEADSIFFVVDTQGTLNQNEWRNEIHPNSNGFRKITAKIINEGFKLVYPNHSCWR